MSEQAIYILDISSYDARGGEGRPFATVEGAKAAAGPNVEWTEGVDNEGNTYWSQRCENSLNDQWVIDAYPLGP